MITYMSINETEVAADAVSSPAGSVGFLVHITVQEQSTMPTIWGKTF